jgi:dihydroxy-acid dehydratase
MADIDRLSRKRALPVQGGARPPNVHVEDVHRAGGVFGILGELDRAGLLHARRATVHSQDLGEPSTEWDVRRARPDLVREFYRAAPGGVPHHRGVQPERRYDTRPRPRERRIRDKAHAYSAGRRPGRAVRQPRRKRLHREDRRRRIPAIWKFSGPARVFESQDDAVEGILGDKVVAGDVVVIRYEGPKGGPGMQEMLYPTSYLKSKGSARLRADHRRALLRRHLRPVHRPRLAGSGRGRRHRAGRRRRHHRDRHSAGR